MNTDDPHDRYLELRLAETLGTARSPDLRTRVLDFAGDDVDDAAVAHLARLTTLEEFSLAGCDGITDAGLTTLGKRTWLRKLNRNVCDGLTAAGADALRAALPGCDPAAEPLSFAAAGAIVSM